MTHLVVVDYPYFTIKRFFGDLEKAHNFVPDSIPYNHYHTVLNKRIFELKDYTNDSKFTINFEAIIK